MPRVPIRAIVVFALLAALALPYLGSPASRLFSRADAAGGAPGASPSPQRADAVAADTTTSPSPTTSATAAASSTPDTATATATTATGSATATATGTSAVPAQPSATATSVPVLFPTAGITSTLVITPANGPPGITVGIHVPVGALPANIPATVSFQDATAFNPSVTLASGLIVNADGSLNTNVTLPPHATGGNARITVTAGTTTVSATFVVTPTLVPNPAVVAPGGTLAITGEGFAANNTITFALGTTPISPVAAVNSDQFGHFSATILIPAGQPLGMVALTASGATSPGSVANTAIVPIQISATAGTPSPSATVSVTGTVQPLITNTPTLLPTAPPIRSETPIGAHTSTTAYFAEGFTGQASTNGKASFAETLAILNPNTVAAAATITYYVQGVVAPIVVHRTIGPRSVMHESVNTDVGPDKIVAAMVTADQRVRVSRTILRTDAHGGRLDGSTTQPAAAPSTTWGFPEGYTGISFQEYLTILNPGPSQASVSVRLAPQATTGAGARTLSLTVPAFSRTTANIRSLNQGNSARSVGMLVSSTVPIVAERVEYFGDGSGSGKFGSTVTVGIVTPATQLRIAYGASGGTAIGANRQAQPAGDQDYVTLLNPNLSGGSATVTVSFTDSGGHTLGSPTTVAVAPGTRRTIVVNTVLGSKAVAPFSVALSASVPIMAEAAQYYGGSPNIGTHPGVAFPALSSGTTDALLSGLGTTLADGGALKRTLYIYNPGAAPLRVSVTYFGPTGTTASASYTVPANGIATANVNADTQATIGAGPVGAEVTAAVGNFVAVALGQTADGKVALPDIGAAAP